MAVAAACLLLAEVASAVLHVRRSPDIPPADICSVTFPLPRLWGD